MHALFPIGLPTPVKTVPDLHALSLPSLSLSVSACLFLSLPSPFSWSSPFPLPLFSHPSPCFLSPPHYSISSSILVSFSHFHILFNTIRLSSLSLSFFSSFFLPLSLSFSPSGSSPLLPSIFFSLYNHLHHPIPYYYYSFLLLSLLFLICPDILPILLASSRHSSTTVSFCRLSSRALPFSPHCQGRFAPPIRVPSIVLTTTLPTLSLTTISSSRVRVSIAFRLVTECLCYLPGCVIYHYPLCQLGWPVAHTFIHTPNYEA